MKLFASLVLALAAAGLAGCATVMEGTGQSIEVSTAPPGAMCSIAREGGTLGEIASTPGSIRIDKSRNDITVTCSKTGYRTAEITRSPRFQGTTFGNIILGGVAGAVVDASTGADYEYPGQIDIALAPAGPSIAAIPYATPLARPAPTAGPMPCGIDHPCTTQHVTVP